MASDLLHLQGLIRKEPQAYKEEFLMQLRHWDNSLQIFALRPSDDSDEFTALMHFLSHLAQSFPKEMRHFPTQLVKLLDENFAVMHPNVRKCMVTALTLLRSRDFIPPQSLLPLFFKMFRCQDKELRGTIYAHIVADVKRVNRRTKNISVNKSLQNLMYPMLQDEHANCAKKCLDVLVDLYKHKIWDDAKTVNVIATACFSKHPVVVTSALHFFLTVDDQMREMDEEANAEPDESETQAAFKELDKVSTKGSKKTRSRERKIENAKKRLRRVTKKKETTPNFEALNLLNDPQGFAERLFSIMVQTKTPYDQRMLLMQVISRLIATHTLVILSFYPYLQKYATPSSKDITLILANVAQAVHNLIPPDAIEPLVQAIANNFVADHCRSEVVAIGLNSIREICSRQPLAMNSTLLSDLVAYRKSKDKGIMMAARSLLQLFRIKNPSLLHNKLRGKFGNTDEALSQKSIQFGAQKTEDIYEAIRLLDEYFERRKTGEITVDLEAEVENSSQFHDHEAEEAEAKKKKVHYQTKKKVDKKRARQNMYFDMNAEAEAEDMEGNWVNMHDDDNVDLGSLDSDDEDGSEWDSDEWEETTEGIENLDEDSSEDEEDEEKGDEEEEQEEEVKKEKAASSKKDGKKSKKAAVQVEEEEEEDEETEEVGEDGWEDVTDDEDMEDNASDISGEWVNVEDGEEEAEGEEEEGDEEEGDEEQDDEEEDEEESEAGPSSESMAKSTIALRMLSDKEWALVRKIKAMKAAEEALNAGSKSKRKAAEISAEILSAVSSNPDERVDVTTIESYKKKMRRTREEKIASAEAGREDNPGFTRREKRRGGGTTNQDKLKNKPFLLTRFAERVQNKQRMGVQEQAKFREKNREKVLRHKLAHKL